MTAMQIIHPAAGAVTPFSFDGADVHVLTINGDPWFVAKDVAELLGYSNPLDAVAKHCKAIVKDGFAIRDSIGRMQKTPIIPERDLYRLVIKSKLPGAERFENWVVSDVLPSIRKSGSYSAAPAIPQSLPEALRLAADLAEQNTALTQANHEQAAKIGALENLFKEGISVAQFCKCLNGVNVQQVGRFLEMRSWLYNESRTGTRWRVGNYARDRFMTEHQHLVSPHGKEPFMSFSPILLRKGAARLYDLYLKGLLPMKVTWDGEFTHDKALSGGD